MAWFDLYIVLVGAALGFGAVVAWASGAPWPVTATAAVLSAIGLLGGLGAWARESHAAPRVLLVGESRGRRQWAIRAFLGDDGMRVCRCPGPHARACPVLAGRPCPVAEHPLAAVVMEGGSGPVSTPCALLGIPVVAVDEASAEGTVIAGDQARVGLARGPWEVTRALRTLVGAAHAPGSG